MSLTVSLPPDLGARLIAEAARTGVPPEQYAAEVLDRHLPPADRRAAAVALIDSWLNDPDPSDHRDALDALTQGVDASRPGQRPHFPPELKGKTW